MDVSSQVPRAPAPQRRPPRLNHKKSRNGCVRCKERRVKCDEKHPTCGGCDRHKAPCIYGAVSTRVNIVSQRHSQSDYFLAGLEAHGKLYNTWCCQGAAYVRDVMTPSTSKAWAVDVLTIASDFPPLLYAILSFAAFYLAAVESHEYIDIARKLFNHYTSYHDTMQWPNSKNADSVALVCHFVSVLTFCEIRYDLSGHQTDRGPRSATTISTHHFSRSQAAFQKFCATRNLVHYKEALSNHLNADLLFWRKDDSNSAHQDAPGYRDVGYTYTQVSHLIDAVSAAIELNFGHEPRPMISSFFGLLPQTFMGLLNERQPRAFIVIAIFFSAVGRVREMWWAEGVGENMINSVRSSLTDDWNRILDQSLKSGLSR